MSSVCWLYELVPEASFPGKKCGVACGGEVVDGDGEQARGGDGDGSWVGEPEECGCDAGAVADEGVELGRATYEYACIDDAIGIVCVCDADAGVLLGKGLYPGGEWVLAVPPEYPVNSALLGDDCGYDVSYIFTHAAGLPDVCCAEVDGDAGCVHYWSRAFWRSGLPGESS